MKRKSFTPARIGKILPEFAAGKTAAEISREHGVSQAAFYKWRQRYNASAIMAWMLLNSNSSRNWKRKTAGSSRCMPMYP